jgi:hypothetical protein
LTDTYLTLFRTVQASGVRRNYGMIKVEKGIGEQEGLDVGIMKAKSMHFLEGSVKWV